MLELEARTRLGALAAGRGPACRRGPDAWRSWGRRARARPRCCGSSPACFGHRAGASCAVGRSGSTPGSGVDLPARAAAGGLPVPGLRAVPQPQRVAQRRLRHRWAARARSGAHRAVGLLERFGMDQPRGGRARAACRAASASAWRWPARSPATRWRCCWTSRSRRSTRARAPAPSASWSRCSGAAGVPALLVTHDFEEAALLADRVAVMDSGRVVQSGHGRGAGGGARLGVRRRPHRRGRAHRHGPSGRARPDRHRARRRRNGGQHRHGRRARRRDRPPVGDQPAAVVATRRRARPRTGCPPRSPRSRRWATRSAWGCWRRSRCSRRSRAWPPPGSIWLPEPPR